MSVDGELFEAENYTLTRLPCDSYSILWTVEDFSRFINADYPSIESSEFNPIGPKSASFKLVLKKDGKNFSISLKLVERANAELIYFTVRLFLLDRFASCHQKSEEFTPQINGETEDNQILATFIVDQTEDEQESYIAGNEAATIRCEIQIFSDPLNYPVTSKTAGYMHYSQLIDDLHRIYEDREFSDGIIEVDGREFFISRAVLAARSPVFKTMFTCGLLESKNGKVTIDDFSADVVQQMLDYIYTGRMSNIEIIAEELLAAGHKYCIEGIQTLAQEELVKIIDEDNVCDLLIQADLYEAQMLKQQCIAFIAQNRNQVIKTAGWKQLTDQSHHQLMVQLIETTKDLQI